MVWMLVGALIVAAGVGMWSLPAGVVVVGLSVMAVGAVRDLLTPDSDGEAEG